MTTVIRRAVESDRGAIYEIEKSAILENCRRSYPLEDITVWAGMLSPDSYGDIDNRYFVVAERDGALVGFGQLDEAKSQVEAIYVSPRCEGQGVGSALLTHLEQRARDSGIAALLIRSTLNAEPFYLRHGYIHLALVRYRIIPSLMLVCVEMRKPLTPTQAEPGASNPSAPPAPRQF